MSKVLSMRLRDEQMQRLQRLARRMNRTPSETAALLLEESLREAEFAFIEFRNSAAGRQPYVKGIGMAVWEVAMVARRYNNDATRTAALLEWPLVKIQAALNYAEAFPEEIQAALDDNNKGFEELKRILPSIQLFEFREDDTGQGSKEVETEQLDPPQ
jgi:uncharacterized protein (DUF433 family)